MAKKVRYGMMAEKLAAQWKKGMIPRTTRVRKGEGYYDIAQRVYGDQKYGPYARQFTDLEAYNQSRPLQVGAKVRIRKPTIPGKRRRPRFRKNKAPTERVPIVRG